MRKREIPKGHVTEAISWIQRNWYCYLMLYWIFYLAAFFLLEMRDEEYYLIECSLDKKIPFVEEFVIPYVSWFGLLAGALFWSMFCCKKDFLRLAFVMFTGNTICLGIYLIAPNGIDLRPEAVPDNLWGWLVGLLYQADTPHQRVPFHPCFQLSGSGAGRVEVRAFKGQKDVTDSAVHMGGANLPFHYVY